MKPFFSQTSGAKSDDSVSCQYAYHAALSAHLDCALEIIKGYHYAKPARAHIWEEGKSARECKKIEIWQLEEKQSDVALALHAFKSTEEAAELRGYMDQYAKEFGI